MVSALQQLTKDILDVFHFESPIAICNGQRINSATGCCLCKEKETIFKVSTDDNPNSSYFPLTKCYMPVIL